MGSTDKSNRTVQITVRLEPKILDGLNEIADRLGIKQSTVAGFALGEFVTKYQAAWNNNTSIQRVVVQEILKAFMSQLETAFDGKLPQELKEAIYGSDDGGDDD